MSLDHTNVSQFRGFSVSIFMTVSLLMPLCSILGAMFSRMWA